MATDEEDPMNRIGKSSILCYDILEQILPHLPVKSLLRFKSVSKQLLSLISDPIFQNTRVADDSNVSRFHLSRYQLVVLLDESLVNADPPADHDFDDQSPWSVTLNSSSQYEIAELYNPFSERLRHIEVLGSCNGLLLLCIDCQTYLWNPSIREHVEISPNDMDLWRLWRKHNCDKHFSWVVAGLGFDSLRDEYKAVLYFEKEDHMFMFKSSIGYWAEVGLDRIPFRYRIHGEYVSETTINGCPYWRVPHSDDSEQTRTSLIFFDTVDDEFKRVPIPLGWHAEYPRNDFNFEFGQLQGCLFAAKKKDVGARKTDIWVMIEHGVRESWTKLFSIPHTPMIYQIRPLGFTHNADEVVLEVTGNKIVVYNLETNEYAFIVGTTNRSSFTGFRSYEYVESLVSPFHFVIEPDVESETEPEKGSNQRRRRRTRRKRRNARRKRRFF